MTFAEDIEDEADGEEIIAVVVGEFGWGGYAWPEGREPVPATMLHVPVQWNDIRPYLDYEHDSPTSPECHAIYAYTKSKVIFVSTYDGATWVTHVPLLPFRGCEPTMFGGG